MRRMLVIDDEEKWIDQVEQWFKPKRYHVLRALSGEEGIEIAKRETPDVIVLDLALKGIQGEDVLTALFHDERTAEIPVAIFSIKSDDRSRRLRIAHEGVVPIIKKQANCASTVMTASKWDLMELEAVVQHLVAQEPKQRAASISIQGNELRMGEGCYQVWVNGEQIELTPLQVRLLAFLDRHRGRPCSVREIEAEVWQDRFMYTESGDRRVRRMIQRLRRRIEPDPEEPIFVVTVTGFGYKLSDADP